jgi:hypothetical protein
MALFRLFLGIALLVIGHRLFWLFLGGVGFLFGFDFAQRTMHIQPQSVILIIALFAGAVGAMVAIVLQKFAIVAGGFFAGGYLLIELLKVAGVRTIDYYWFIFVAGGLVGAVLMSVVFDWTLIILSSLIGSILILQTFHFRQPLSEFLFICLVLLGVGMQFGLIRKSPP